MLDKAKDPAPDARGADGAAPRKEPGNRLGAVGLVATLVGAGGLAFEVPPDLLSIGPALSWTCVAVGLACLLGGLAHEWRGPRRWSALLPGVVALGFAAWAGAAAFAESVARCERTTVRTADLGTVGWSCRSDEPVDAIVLLVQTPWARGVPALSRALAERDVAVYAVEPRAWVTSPGPVLAAVAEQARREVGSVPLGIATWGETARDLSQLSAMVDADFGVALSVLALDPIEGLEDMDIPVLFAYGVADSSYPGHGNASALVDAVGQAGMEGAVIRVFLGADRDLLAPVARPSLQPTGLAAGWIDVLSGFIQGAAVAE